MFIFNRKRRRILPLAVLRKRPERLLVRSESRPDLRGNEDDGRWAGDLLRAGGYF